jgi:hypothetical protein
MGGVMAKQMEAVRVTRLGSASTIAGAVLAAGAVVRLPWDEAEAIVKSGRAEWAHAVKVGPRGLLIGSTHHGSGSTVLLPRRKAVEVHRNRAAEIVDASQFDEAELKRPEDGVPADPWAGDLKVQVQVIGKSFFHANATHVKGDIFELPEPVAARGIHAKALKLAKGAAFSRAGVDYLASLGTRRGWF